MNMKCAECSWHLYSWLVICLSVCVFVIYFLNKSIVSLQANNYNIKIDEIDEVQVMWMKLLSRQLPHEAMEEFRAPSLQTAHSTLKNK